MRKSICRLLLIGLVSLGVVAAQKSTTQKKADSGKTSSTAPKPSAARKKPPAKKTTPSKTAAPKKRVSSRRRVASWRQGQQQPTPQRYKEIQQALADRGYLEGPPDGKWGTESVEALKKFQGDKNLDPTGKLDSLSLIALGLGPNRDDAKQNETLAPAESKEQP